MNQILQDKKIINLTIHVRKIEIYIHIQRNRIMLLEDPLLTYDGHTFRYASVGGVETEIATDLSSNNSRSIKRTYSDGAKVSAFFFSFFYYAFKKISVRLSICLKKCI